MKEYIKFLSKRVFLRKSNIITIFSVMMVVLFVLIMNMRTQNLYENLTTKIEIMKINLESDTKILHDMDEDDVQFSYKQRSIEYTNLRLKRSEKLLELFEKKDYPSFYKLYEEDLKEDIEVHNNTIEVGENADSYFEQQLAYIKYLDAHKLIYEAIDLPIFGLSFMVFMSDLILPISILISIIYILAQAFTLDYAKDINISHLFPMGRKKVFYTKIGVGIVTSIIVYLIITLSAFAFASLLNHNMGLSYPFITMDVDGNYIGVSLLSGLIKWMSLGILFFVAVACFMYVLAIWIKEDTALFLTGITIVLGVAYMPKFIQALHPIAHQLPTTYMNYVSVVQGNVAMQYGNIGITFQHGIFVLLACIGATVLLAYLSHTMTSTTK